jgi:hypothetical protein
MLRCIVTLHRTVLHCTALYCTALYCTVLHCTALHCTVLHCTVLHCTVLYCTVICFTVLYCSILYCAVQYCIVLYCSILQYRVVHAINSSLPFCLPLSLHHPLTSSSLRSIPPSSIPLPLPHNTYPRAYSLYGPNQFELLVPA